MQNDGGGWLLQGRRFIVDLLTGVTALALVVAATGASTEFLVALLIPIVLLGASLLLEPDATQDKTIQVARPRGSRSSAEPEPA
jgi:hypothetical protein